MPTAAENACCKQSSCITSTELFETSVLDINVLSIAIVNCSDTFVELADYSPSSYRKAAYRQFVLWREDILGEATERLYLLVLYGVFRTDTLLLMDFTYVSKNISA